MIFEEFAGSSLLSQFLSENNAVKKYAYWGIQRMIADCLKNESIIQE